MPSLPQDSASPASASPVVFLSAGEASGERYGTLLIEALRRLAPGAAFFGLGGPGMAAAGLDRVVRAEDVAHMGITEVVRHAPYIYRQYRRLKRSIAERRPDLAILIDFPDVNLRLARTLRRRGVPVVYFVSPQLWAWKRRRIHRVRRYVTRMLVIFPFEEAFYRRHGVAVDFVGHPLADLPQPALGREAYARDHSLDPDKQWIVLLPGSRMREVLLNLPEMAAAADLLGPTDFEFLLPIAPTLDRTEVERLAQQACSKASLCTVPDARLALHHARASIVASGTATVEAALIGSPFVVVYRLSRLSYSIARRVVRVRYIAMPNLIAGRRVVPELIQGDFTAANIVQELTPLLKDTPQRAAMLRGLAEVRAALRPRGEQGGAIDRAAAIALSLLAGDQPQSSSLTVPQHSLHS
jgi:lipid-A-disaccharide synthase